MSYEEGKEVIIEYNKIKAERDKYKAERDTLIDDIAVLRANEKRLEQIRDIKDSALKGADIKIKALERENNDLRLQADTYFDEWQNVKNLYNALTQHIRDKAEANPNVDRYIALVNYIDRLEMGEK